MTFHPGRQRLGRIGDTGDLFAVVVCDDGKSRQATVDADPATVIGGVARRVLLDGVEVGGLGIERDPPAARVVAHSGEQDLGAVLGEHPPQRAGVVMHADLADAGQGDRAGAVVVADADC